MYGGGEIPTPNALSCCSGAGKEILKELIQFLFFFQVRVEINHEIFNTEVDRANT